MPAAIGELWMGIEGTLVLWKRFMNGGVFSQ